MEKDQSSIWSEACRHLESTLPKDVFDRWIRVIDCAGVREDTLMLSVANDFYQSWLVENYLPLIQNAIAVVCGREYKIEFQVDASKCVQPAATREVRREEPRAPAAKPTNRSPLDPRYTFDNFVVGPSNSFAHASAMAVAQSPAMTYNPLFIYGGSGLGKTHLMQAIGHHIASRGKSSVCYMRCEAFTNEYIDALQRHSLPQFRKKYRAMDILLIDDVHFLAGKEALQEEFFHTFNALHESRKQIVLTSDRPTSELAGLQPRLVTRFDWGMVTELEMPDVETRTAILRKKQEQMNLKLPDDVVAFVAEHIRSNIRKLEGCLIRVASYASLTGRPVSLEMTENLLRDAIDQEQREALTIETVQRTVAEYYDIRLGDMTSKQRPATIAFPRQVAMYLCRSLTRNSLPSIGNAFGRNHATVLHACKLVTERIKTDPGFRQTVSVIKQRLGAH